MTSAGNTRHKRSLRLGALVAALGLVLAACAAGGVAATVDDVQITDDQIAGLTTGSEDAVVADAEQFRSLLTNAIVTASMVTAAERDFGLEDLSSKASTDAFLAQATPQDIALIGRVAENPQLTENAVELVTVQLNVRDSVKEALASDQAFLEEIWQNDQNQLVQVCASHVLLATEGEANAALDRYNAGEELAVLAAELSLDTQSPGGALPCPSMPSDFVEPFAQAISTAPEGQIVGPVETQFGWHIILVESRQFPGSLSELAADPIRWIPPAIMDAAWIGWLNEALEASDISVRSQIGTWSKAADGIIPPTASP